MRWGMRCAVFARRGEWKEFCNIILITSLGIWKTKVSASQAKICYGEIKELIYSGLFRDKFNKACSFLDKLNLHHRNQCAMCNNGHLMTSQ